MSQLPVGTITFLLTDVEGSSRLWEKLGSAMGAAMSRHHQIIYEEIERHGGKRPSDQGEGDSIVGAFARAIDAVACALEIQRSLTVEEWPQGIELRVRIAVHTGDAELRDEQNYTSATINRGARLRSIGHGGQVLLSQATWDLVRDSLPAGVTFRDLGTHQLKDLTNPEHVHQLVHSDIPTEFPPLKSLATMPTNLPVQLTRFIGRQNEVEAVKQKVAERRLVTLTGAAGCGKTRLALQVGAEVIEDFPEGVWFIDLAPIGDPEAVASVAAAAVGIQQDVNRSAADSLIDHLRDRKALMLLDNCEHLIAASSALSERVLGSCPRVKLLATSREPLGITGESPWRVPSLVGPGPADVSPETLEQFEATELFLDRARTAAPTFELTPGEATAIAQICDRLDGIPLAIELAAARVEVLTCRQIAAKLDDSFRLLVGGSRTALERQQTIRAAVEWSYELLGEEERTLLRRLSAFAGGFSLEAAEQVTGGAPLEASSILDILSSLVRKSLIGVSRQEDGIRYGMLETIRQYSRERLREAGESEEVRTRHRDWFRDLAERAEEGLMGAEQMSWVSQIEQEQGNLRAALEWSADSGDHENLLRTTWPLWRYWMLRDPSSGIRWIKEGLAGDTSDLTRANGLSVLAFLDSVFGNPQEALPVIEQAVVLAKSAGHAPTIARTLNVLGNIQMLTGESEEAARTYEEALEIARALGDELRTVAILANLGAIAAVRGDVEVADRSFAESLPIVQRLGDKANLAILFARMAEFDRSTSRFDQARSNYLEGYRLMTELGSPAATMPSYGRSVLEAQIGDLEEAQRWADAARVSLSDAETPLARHVMMALRGWIAYLGGEYEESRSLLETAVSLGREIGEITSLGTAQFVLGLAAEASSDLAFAREQFDDAIHGMKSRGELSEAREPLTAKARVLVDLDVLDESSESAREALVMTRKLGDSLGTAYLLEVLGSTQLRRREYSDAVKAFSSSAALRETLGAVGWPHLVPWREKRTAALREALGHTEFEMAWKEGKSMSLEEALASLSTPYRPFEEKC